jgi:hypothetical protein
LAGVIIKVSNYVNAKLLGFNTVSIIPKSKNIDKRLLLKKDMAAT